MFQGKGTGNRLSGLVRLAYVLPPETEEFAYSIELGRI
jgi:hypothetical protein